MQDIDAQIPIERYDEVDSTNRLARRAIESDELGDRPTMFVASRQTAGAGRFGRAWESPPGGLWCTLAWPVDLSPRRVLDGLGLRIGLACAHAIEHTLAIHGHDANVQLKWPNDVLINGKKVLGVLCEVIEHREKKYVLAGVGVNANFSADDLPEEIRPYATTLQDAIHGRVQLERLLRDLRQRLRDALMEQGLPAETLRKIRERLAGVGEPATITLPDGSKESGTLTGLTDDGRLTLATDEGDYTAPMGAELAPPQPAVK